MRIRLVSACLLSLMLVGTTTVSVRGDELSDAVQRQQELQRQQSAANGKLNQLTYTADKLKRQIADLDSQIAVANNELKQKQAAYNQAQAQAEALQKELELKEKQFEERQQAFGQRLRGIYEDGQVSYLEVLFQASSLGDFISRLDYLASLVDNDQQLLAAIEEEKSQLEQDAKDLAVKRDAAAALNLQAATAKAELDNKKAQQQQALSETKKAQDDVLVQIEKLAADSASMTRTIQRLSSDLAARNGSVSGTISIWPLDGYYEISSPFGWRIHPITKQKSLHTGTDIPAPSGTPIKAAGVGVVLYTGDYGAYGNVVIIDHGSGYTTLYAHQSTVGAVAGQQVAAGQIIGYVGSTGWSTGAHLHFEVRLNGNPTDPLQFFPGM